MDESDILSGDGLGSYDGSADTGAYSGSSYDTTPIINGVLSSLGNVVAMKIGGVVQPVNGGLAGGAGASPVPPIPVQPASPGLFQGWALKLGVGVGVVITLVAVAVVGVFVAIWKLL